MGSLEYLFSSMITDALYSIAFTSFLILFFQGFFIPTRFLYVILDIFIVVLCSQVEDIVDTGTTLSSLIANLVSKGASSISVCTLLDKPARRKIQVELVGEGKFYRGFEVRFVCNCLHQLVLCFHEKHALGHFLR